MIFKTAFCFLIFETVFISGVYNINTDNQNEPGKNFSIEINPIHLKIAYIKDCSILK